ncbi:MAG: nucleotidyltransferase domain-containing protein [Patescibacteria group bacterium]
MSQRGIKVKSIINKYSSELSKKIKVDGVFLFGSAARGEMKKYSDIDLIILSTDFDGMNFMRRLQLLSRTSWVCAKEAAMDIIGYTPEEFKELRKSNSPNLKKIVREGYFIR